MGVGSTFRLLFPQG